MELMSDQKQTTEGMISTDWENKVFGSLYLEASRNGIYKPSEFQGRGVRIVNMGEMFGYEFISDQDMSRIELTKHELTIWGLHDGDLLFGRRSVVPAGAGKCSLIVNPKESITFESSIIRVRLRQSEATPLFYYYFFASPFGRSTVSTIVSGTNIKGVRASELKELQVPFPPRVEQQAIATALSDADALIESLEQLLAKKRQIKQGAMQELLTGKRRLPGFEEAWAVKHIGEFTDCTAGGTPSTRVSEYWGGTIRWMSSGELNLKTVNEVEGRITEVGLKNSSTKMIPPRCVLIGLAGQGKTRGTVAMNTVALCTNQSIAAIFPNELFDPMYLYYNLDNRYDELRELSAGDGGRGGLNLTIIRSLEIPFPELQEQTAIATILSDMDADITALEAKLAKAFTIKKGMMQELLTGRVRLI